MSARRKPCPDPEKQSVVTVLTPRHRLPCPGSNRIANRTISSHSDSPFHHGLSPYTTPDDDWQLPPFSTRINSITIIIPSVLPIHINTRTQYVAYSSFLFFFYSKINYLINLLSFTN